MVRLALYITPRPPWHWIGWKLLWAINVVRVLAGQPVSIPYMLWRAMHKTYIAPELEES